jgi:hypothetical protein
MFMFAFALFLVFTWFVLLFVFMNYDNPPERDEEAMKPKGLIEKRDVW